MVENNKDDSDSDGADDGGSDSDDIENPLAGGRTLSSFLSLNRVTLRFLI